MPVNLARSRVTGGSTSPDLTVDAATIGAGIRRERQRRRMTLAELSAATNLTIGTLSQIERGLSDPSLASLRRISGAFEVPMFQFLVAGSSPDIVVRRDQRRTIRSVGSEIEFQLVSSETNGDYELMAATMRPGVVDPPTPGGHPYEETVCVLRGIVQVEVAGHRYVLNDGDTLRIDRDLPHQYANVGPEVAELLMVLSPAMYRSRARS